MFKVGDEVEHVGSPYDAFQVAVYGRSFSAPTKEKAVVTRAWHSLGYDRIWVSSRPDIVQGYDPDAWRKVAKRSDTLSIESFLTIKDGFEEPRKVVEPVRRKEGVK